MKNDQKAKLRQLPAVHEIVAEVSKIKEIINHYDASAITWAARTALEKARVMILTSKVSEDGKVINIDKGREESQEVLSDWVNKEVLKELKSSSSTFRRIINATGVVLHTNCGRALLAPEVADFVAQQAVHYSNLELDIETGNRGSRYDHVQELLTELTGAEASIVVNNNAAAVLLIMNTLAKHKEVIVSRGELVEVGGSFRIPEVLKAGGAKLVEVGATNKTWLKDYRNAISSDTALFLKVHTSNYRIEGFQHAVTMEELVGLGTEFGLPVVEDLGSGSFLDGAEQGLPKEPTIQEAVQAGASLVSFSGDKLLGGPQAGIIVGKKELIDQLKANQLTRALRVDKLTLAALAGTLRYYQRGEVTKIPVWRMLSKTKSELQLEAERLLNSLKGLTTLQAEVQANHSRVGGGAFPTANLPSSVCALKPLEGTAVDLERFLRQGNIPILSRIFKDNILFDPRTLLTGDYEEIVYRLEEWERLYSRNKD